MLRNPLPVPRVLGFAALFALLIVVCTTAPDNAHAQPADQNNDQRMLVELVNQLRAQYGLPAYQPNAQLMAAAQAHSEWAASMGTHSHTGVGGSTPSDRAYAAGYGSGNTVYVWENIYWGTNGTAQSAVAWWTTSPIHFQGMTHTTYTEIGTGAAYGPNGGFFTLLFGWVSGSPAPVVTPQTGANIQPLPYYPFEEVETAEPREDGSIVHTVGQGQNLYYISEAYGVPVSEILALNGLPDSVLLQPGDELIIRPSPIAGENAVTGPLYHTVLTGQTLSGIALAYGVTIDQLIALNNLSPSALIFPGDVLLIIPDPSDPTPNPEPLYHVVEQGQTLIDIALLYGVDLNTLYTLNNLTATSLIFPGDRILIRPAPPTETPLPATDTPVPTLTALPRATPSPTVEATSLPADPERKTGGIPPAMLALLIGSGLLIAVAGLSLFLRRKKV